jgi:hypothetical protein
MTGHIGLLHPTTFQKLKNYLEDPTNKRRVDHAGLKYRNGILGEYIECWGVKFFKALPRSDGTLSVEEDKGLLIDLLGRL